MASWPTSIPTDATLYIAVNELQTNLSAGINAAVTTVGLNSTTSFPTVGLVLIDNEIIKYTGVAGSNLTGCTRGFDGTTAAVHSSAAIVSFAICANHHNVTKDEIIALATYLSNNLGTGAQPLANGSRALASNGSGKIIESSVTSTELGYLSGVTSAIQTQLAAKKSIATGNAFKFETTDTSGNLQETTVTPSRAVATDSNGLPTASATTAAELGFVSGLTSAVQTQLDAKLPKAGGTMTGAIDMGSHKITSLTNGSAASDAAAFGQIPVYTEWTDYFSTATKVGWVTPSGFLRYAKLGKTVFVAFSITGTSNSTSTTFTLPFTVAQTFDVACCFTTDNGTNSGNPGMVEGIAAGTTITVYHNTLGGSWTASGVKVIAGAFLFEATA